MKNKRQIRKQRKEQRERQEIIDLISNVKVSNDNQKYLKFMIAIPILITLLSFVANSYAPFYIPFLLSLQCYFSYKYTPWAKKIFKPIGIILMCLFVITVALKVFF